MNNINPQRLKDVLRKKLTVFKKKLIIFRQYFKLTLTHTAVVHTLKT